MSTPARVVQSIIKDEIIYCNETIPDFEEIIDDFNQIADNNTKYIIEKELKKNKQRKQKNYNNIYWAKIINNTICIYGYVAGVIYGKFAEFIVCYTNDNKYIITKKIIYDLISKKDQIHFDNDINYLCQKFNYIDKSNHNEITDFNDYFNEDFNEEKYCIGEEEDFNDYFNEDFNEDFNEEKYYMEKEEDFNFNEEKYCIEEDYYTKKEEYFNEEKKCLENIKIFIEKKYGIKDFNKNFVTDFVTGKFSKEDDKIVCDYLDYMHKTNIKNINIKEHEDLIKKNFSEENIKSFFTKDVYTSLFGKKI